MFLIDNILLAPFKGFVWITGKLRDQALAELTDRSKIQEELLELQMLYEIEELSEEEYNRREAELIERLNAIQEAT